MRRRGKGGKEDQIHAKPLSAVAFMAYGISNAIIIHCGLARYNPKIMLIFFFSGIFHSKENFAQQFFFVIISKTNIYFSLFFFFFFLIEILQHQLMSAVGEQSKDLTCNTVGD